MSSLYTAEFVQAKFEAASAAYDQAVSAAAASMDDPQTQVSVTRQRIDLLREEMDYWRAQHEALTSGGRRIRMFAAVPTDG